MQQDPEGLEGLAWPPARLGEAIELLARRAGLLPGPVEAPAPPDNLDQADEATLGQWVDRVAAQLGIEAEPVASAFAEVARMVRRAAPAILRLPRDDADVAPRFLALLAGGERLTLIGADLQARRVPAQVVEDAMCRDLVAARVGPVEQLLADAGVPERRRERARRAIVQEQLSAARVAGGWILRLSPAAGMWQQAVEARIYRPLLVLLGATLGEQLLSLVSWWVVGRSALTGQFDPAWIMAWGLTLFSMIPLQLLVSSSQSSFSVGLGGILKQRLLYGALKLAPDAVRHQGMGQFIARINQSEAVESMGFSGGLLTVVSIVQLATAFGVLALGAGGWIHAGLLFLWTAATVLAGWQYYRYSVSWMNRYNAMSNNLAERMVGHRTRLAQEDHRRWHVEEDQELDLYMRLSERHDRAGIVLAAIPSSWLVAGLAGIAFPLLAGQQTLTGLAVSVGGVLLAHQALSEIVGGMESLVGAALAWQQVAPLFQAAAEPEDAHSPALLPQSDARDKTQPLLLATGVDFRYRPQGQLVLRGCDLRIQPGDRVLLEGPSGGGKTTMAAVLAGLRAPEAGLLLLWGYDHHSLGPRRWRQRVAVAPQFHENHVFTETMAFNLLMGRRWPPGDDDLAEAEAICRELGLGDLLDRMPSGMQQMVGESGWQLSHGERSRVFIARALLQKADLIIMDESFGALDPENLQRALRCAIERSPTLLVIAHP
ncbi:MAG: ATP-binding cassette domain-containing protein [Chloroflexi bacterium]|nr:ATP-binding cassette domain-containing protein [Chloroflexota bacterium]